MSQNTDKTIKYTYQAEQSCPENLTLNVGEKIRFVAPTNPSTGYGWYLKNPLQYLSATSRYEAAPTEGYLIVGAGGEEHFTFQANSVGTETIHLVYSRPWQAQEIASEWICPVIIK